MWIDVGCAPMRNVTLKLRLCAWALLGLIAGCSGGGSTSVNAQGGDSDKPASLPSIRLYSDQSPLNQKIAADAELDPDSQRYAALIARTAPSLLVQVKQYSAPVYFADENTARVDVRLACGPVWEMGVTMLADAPIPSFAEPANDVDGADNPVPAGECGEDSSQDNNMVIIDLNTRCEYDLWQARKENGAWVASWGNAISIDDVGVYENGMSTRGSGFAFLAGVIWPHELQQGEIPHALLFALPDELVRSGGPVSPATESDGVSTDSMALPEGARLRLDPALDLNSLNLTPAELTIAKAMQDYGLFLTDMGGSSPVMALYAVDPLSVLNNPYNGFLPDEDYPALSGIPLDRLQALALPPQDANFQQNMGLPAGGGCATFQ